jgi:Na+/phosphate symporter
MELKYIPLIICIAGLILYHLTLTPKINETGRLMFWVGLLITLAKL